MRAAAAALVVQGQCCRGEGEEDTAMIHLISLHTTRLTPTPLSFHHPLTSVCILHPTST